MADLSLPEPDSPALAALGLGAEERAVYRVLYEHRDEPLTMQEIRGVLREKYGDNEHADRRKRNLNPFFLIEQTRAGREVRYRLVSRKAENQSRRLGISEKTRAEVLQYGRCAMCGRTPLDHGVVLQVDHKRPQEWGGTDDIENLQPLCEECNRGKKNFFATLNEYGPQIAEASESLEPHRRIAAILRAFYPEEVRSDIIEMVAHSHQYQTDWEKRTRELRYLGWEFSIRRKREQGRTRSYYRLTKYSALPETSLAAEVKRVEEARKRARSEQRSR